MSRSPLLYHKGGAAFRERKEFREKLPAFVVDGWQEKICPAQPLAPVS
jgi:hypothetical protein